jgi:hypothetical protein
LRDRDHFCGIQEGKKSSIADRVDAKAFEIEWHFQEGEEAGGCCAGA